VRARRPGVDANPELQEREVVKLATLATAVAGALRDRGVADPAASLTAQAGTAVFAVAFGRWIGDTGRRHLPDLIRESFDELRTLTA
jgi:hypothetical protein